MVGRSSVAKKLAFLISALSSPFLTAAVFGIIPIMYYAPSQEFALSWSLAYMATVIGIPFAYILSQVMKGAVTDMHVALREQRSKPILAAVSGSVVCAGLFQELEVPRELLVLALAIALNGVVFLFATMFTKISFHVGTFVGSVLSAGILVDNSLFYFLLAVPLIAWAGAQRGRHSPFEVVLAASVSLVSTVTLFGVANLL